MVLFAQLISKRQKIISLRDPDSLSPKKKILSTLMNREFICFFAVLFYLSRQKKLPSNDLKKIYLLTTIFLSIAPSLIFYQERLDANTNIYSDEFQKVINDDLEKIGDLIRNNSLKKKYISQIADNISKDNIRSKMFSFVSEYLNMSVNLQAQKEIEIFTDYMEKLIDKYRMVPGSHLNNLNTIVQSISNPRLQTNSTWISLRNNLNSFSAKSLIGLYEISVIKDQINSLSNILGNDYNRTISALSKIKEMPEIPKPDLAVFENKNSLENFLSQIREDLIQKYYTQPIQNINISSPSLEEELKSFYTSQLMRESQQAAALLVERVFYNFDSISKSINDYISTTPSLYEFTNKNEFDNNISYNFNLLANAVDKIIVNNRNNEIQDEIHAIQEQYSTLANQVDIDQPTSIQYPSLSLLNDESNIQDGLKSIYNNLSQCKEILNNTSSVNNNLNRIINNISGNSEKINRLYNDDLRSRNDDLKSRSFPDYNFKSKKMLRQITKDMYINSNYSNDLFLTKNTINGVYDGLYKTLDGTSEIYLKTSNSFSNSAQALYNLYNNSFNNLYLLQPILFQNDIVDENFNSLTQHPTSTIKYNSFPNNTNDSLTVYSSEDDKDSLTVNKYEDGILLENTIIESTGYKTSFCIRAIKGNPKIFFYTKKGEIINHLYFFSPEVIFASPNTIYTHANLQNYRKMSDSGSSESIAKTEFEIVATDLTNFDAGKWPIQKIKFYSFPYSKTEMNLSIGDPLISKMITFPVSLDAYNLVLVIYFSNGINALTVVSNNSNCQCNFWSLQNTEWVLQNKEEVSTSVPKIIN